MIEVIEDLMTDNQKVMLFSPVKADDDLMRLMLKSHAALAGVDEYRYYNDNGNNRLDALACEAKLEAEIWNADDESSYSDHQWTGDRVARIAEIRNYAIQQFLKSDCVWLFIVDSDVICHPDQVAQLLAAKHPIVSAVYWTRFPKSGNVYLPNCWDSGQYDFDSPESILRLAEPGTYEVGGLGACTLIHRSVLEAGVNYSPIKGFTLWGEDRWFCMRAVANGFRLWVDTHLVPYHVYRDTQLEEAKAWYNDGARRYLFSTWLNAEWRSLITNPPEAPFDQAAYEAQLAAEGKRPVLYLCQPGDTFSGRYMSHWNHLMAYCFTRFGMISPFHGYSSCVHSIRQTLWDQMRESASTIHEPTGRSLRPTYILSLDDDNTLSPAQLELMMETLDTQPSVGMVAAWTHIYKGDNDPCPAVSCGKLDENQLVHPLSEDLMALSTTDLIELDWTGFPAVLIRAECLEAAGPDAFIPIRNEAARHKLSGEDVAFCINLRTRSPYRIVVDRRIYVPHLKLRADQPRNPALLALTLADPSAVPVPVQAAV